MIRPYLQFSEEDKAKVRAVRSELKEGDRVECVNYGHLHWISASAHKQMHEAGFSKSRIPENIVCEDNGVYYLDLNPELVGQKGTVQYKSYTQGIVKYSIHFDNRGNISWLSNYQLKKL